MVMALVVTLEHAALGCLRVVGWHVATSEPQDFRFDALLAENNHGLADFGLNDSLLMTVVLVGTLLAEVDTVNS